MSDVKQDSVTVICNGETEKWDTRKEAIEFYLRAVAGSDGSECRRYTKIYIELMSGNTVCTDEE